ncbi:alpha-E domain-containing protein [Altererythrobacter arenosus]|uniref:Alpha-E domain-containing protein n=1 Tax=Altererythrobacter arenosus TaxID=3032592 RepID=A0ABY8FNL9_9SPHN|nr:alpha-E domain-containing protein [Altererythrobacter sp. CAU 1644]WFL76457.1 alpha-E domain-containing protein [Altererythrobacter sp. CAU 1644]
MLGKTANGLFWMFRYLERAQNTARLIDAGLRMALTRDIDTAEDEWRSVIATSGQKSGYEAHHGTYTGIQVWNFILRDKDNPANVREMFKTVRTNARLVRTAISDEVWEAINTSWMSLDKMLSRSVSQGHVGEVIRTIRRAGTLAHGAMTGSMLRDEGYHFARAGTFLERADSTARILDMKYYLLLPSLSYVGTSLDSGQWDQILRSVAGDRVYTWLNSGDLDARGIVEFLVLDQRFPRSLAFCHGELRDQLAALARIHGKEGNCNAIIREADMQISELTVDEIFENGLHEFLNQFTRRNAAIGQAIADDYRFYA